MKVDIDNIPMKENKKWDYIDRNEKENSCTNKNKLKQPRLIWHQITGGEDLECNFKQKGNQMVQNDHECCSDE